MTELSFEWDPGKAAVNALKHGITFEEAKTVFHDEYALLIDDPDHSKSEDRFILMGRSLRAECWWWFTVCVKEARSSV